jgi:ferredoxin
MLKLQEPAQPCAADWAFIDELKSEFRRKPNWERKVPRLEELDLTEGVRIINYFVDPEGLLETAWEGLERFFKDLSIPIISHKYIFKDKIIEKNAGVKDEDLYQKIEGIADIIIKKEDLDTYESYFIEITKENIVIKAGDTEGIRRGIFYLEDMILSSEGPFLIPTVIERKPWIKNRISRCFFGPIKRPPLNRDELMDDVDYYPDEYLNRLAHEGINVLWLTVEFRDICKTKLVPEYGKERDKRISKLKRTVEKCRRYGIKIFIFCIEPRIWEKDDPLILNNPEMAGATVGDNVCFCPFPEVSQKYLYEAVKSIFTEVPKLGGIFSITHGERPTSCLSSVSATSNTEVNCPRCSKKEKSEILEATHRPIIRAMHEINPDAQFISWPYMSHDLPVAPWVYTIPERLPKETVLAFNFESGIEKEQLSLKEVFYLKAYVNKDECISCGLCESICPEVFEMDDDGMAVAIDEELDGEKLECAEEAAAECPTEAITVE